MRARGAEGTEADEVLPPHQRAAPMSAIFTTLAVYAVPRPLTAYSGEFYSVSSILKHVKASTSWSDSLVVCAIGVSSDNFGVCASYSYYSDPVYLYRGDWE